MPIQFIPILASIGRILLAAGVFSAADALISKVFDQNEETITDEIFAAAITAGVVTKSQSKQIADAARVLPLPQQVTTPQAAAEYLETLSKNEAGLKALNARLGGFAPLAIKFTQTAAKILPKLEKVGFKKVAFITAIITWLIWLPQLMQQFLDQGVFAPEQGNAIFESWGLPFRWAISETRATQTALEETKLERALKGFTAAATDKQPRTIIRMAETTKPQLFTGILFAAPLSKPEAFSRHLDDEITDLGDLQNDLKLNLANWVKGLAGRVSVAISVRNNPIISQTEKLSGTWLVASLSYNLIDGGRVFLDSIPLGPINPVKYMPKVSEIRTIENQTFGEFRPESVKELIIPSSAMTALTKEGELVPIVPVGTARAAAAPAAPAPEPVQTQEDFRAAGLPVPPGTPSVAAIVAAAARAAAAPAPAAARRKSFVVDQIARVNDPAGLNVRSFAGTAGTKLFAIPVGTQVRIASESQLRDGFEWYNVEVRTGVSAGRGGWVAGEFLT